MPNKGKKGKNSRRSSLSKKTASKMKSCMWGGNAPVTVNTGAESYARYIYGNTNEQTTDGMGGNLIKMNNPSGWIGGAGAAMGELKQKIKEIKTSLSALPKLVNQAVKEKSQTKTRKPKPAKMEMSESEAMDESMTTEEPKAEDSSMVSETPETPSEETEVSESPSEETEESEGSKKGGNMLGAAIVPVALLAANQLYKPSRGLNNLSYGRKSGFRKTLKKLYKRRR